MGSRACKPLAGRNLQCLVGAALQGFAGKDLAHRRFPPNNPHPPSDVVGDHPHDAFGGKAIQPSFARFFSRTRPKFAMGVSNACGSPPAAPHKGNERLHAPDCPAAKAGAPIVQYRHGDLEPLALGIEHIGGRNPHVRETHRGSRGGTDSHFIFVLAVADAGPCRLDHECRDLARGR